MSNQNEKLFSTRNMCYVGLMTAVTAIMAQISIIPTAIIKAILASVIGFAIRKRLRVMGLCLN